MLVLAVARGKPQLYRDYPRVWQLFHSPRQLRTHTRLLLLMLSPLLSGPQAKLREREKLEATRAWRFINNLRQKPPASLRFSLPFIFLYHSRPLPVPSPSHLTPTTIKLTAAAHTHYAHTHASHTSMQSSHAFSSLLPSLTREMVSPRLKLER